MSMAAYDEQKHPRAGDGKFTTKGYSEADGGTDALSAHTPEDSPSKLLPAIHDVVMEDKEVAEAVVSANRCHDTISDSTAKTIALMHSGDYKEMRQLSMGMPFDPEELRFEIADAREAAGPADYKTVSNMWAFERWAEEKNYGMSTYLPPCAFCTRPTDGILPDGQAICESCELSRCCGDCGELHEDCDC